MALTLVFAACAAQPPAADGPPAGSPQATADAPVPAPTALPGAPPNIVSAPAPDGIEADGDCPILFPLPTDDMAAEARALVPLKTGLTLSHLWRAVQSADEIECLAHVVSVDRQSVRVTNTCLSDGAATSFPRRTCRKDLRSARAFQTRVGMATPETLVGATSYNLSREAYLELKREGATRHRYIELRFAQSGGPFTPRGDLDVTLDGSLVLDGTGVIPTIVNDAVVDLPVLRVSGTLRGTVHGQPGESRVSGAVVDDEWFPLMLHYRLLDLGEHEFSVRYTKISYPTAGSVAKRLAESETVDVYGIYFDFGSDTIRPESEPVLKEIADAMAAHPDWSLSISGHTDNVGSDGANLELSKRRSAAVRTALVERHRISADRLVTAGHGESAPKDTNDTPEGRARNRRVELSRR